LAKPSIATATTSAAINASIKENPCILLGNIFFMAIFL